MTVNRGLGSHTGDRIIIFQTGVESPIYVNHLTLLGGCLSTTWDGIHRRLAVLIFMQGVSGVTC